MIEVYIPKLTVGQSVTMFHIYHIPSDTLSDAVVVREGEPESSYTRRAMGSLVDKMAEVRGIQILIHE